MKFSKTAKRISITLGAFLMSASMVTPAIFDCLSSADISAVKDETAIKRLSEGVMDTSLEAFYDKSTVYKLSDVITDSQEISVIVVSDAQNLLAAYRNASKISEAKSVAEYVSSQAGKKAAEKINNKNFALKQAIRGANISCTFGESYDVILSGFEVSIQAKDFNRLQKAVGSDATLIVGEEYESCESQVVNNKVDIDEETGIFENTVVEKYNGSGTTVAVLDTGLDYTHSAFSPDRFDGEEGMTVDSLTGVVPKLQAATFTQGLTAQDVYVNKKVPYAYDYADKDSDVYPLNSEHGTHVSGVIVGEDDTITGVANDAQLVSMKVFSDITEGARTSWLLAALQDCVLLQVDVINMSLGSSSGFSNFQDDMRLQEVYESIRDAGISLVCAASNDYSSAFGSEKNGNNGLTSNPSTGTVGSPSTFPAALSVASVSGKKTPYIMYNNRVIYFNEASDQASKPKDFVGELLSAGVGSGEFEYVTIPGVGRAADYTGIDVRGKIALVQRGSNTFEDKIRIAEAQGALGVVIYNNVSGKISMTVGRAKIPACSISQDDGKVLAAAGTGTMSISASQVAGPFMSDFSSWGPTEDLKIKPEITAHGGEILSAVPGQRYDRLSGTSMASPNQAGITSIVRQYVQEKWKDLNDVQVTARVNQLMMSTADPVKNTIGLPYAVRKQGAGLASLTKATTTPAYISTFEKDGTEMDKTKLEYGDDPAKTGVYEMTFAINNTGSASLTYNVSGIVVTEGVNETLTVRGDTTVTEEGYKLEAPISVVSVTGGTNSGNTVSVGANATAKVTVRVTLTNADKTYLDRSFANGMYVEGFITCEAASGTDVNISVPFLAFYGDWNRAPIFDLDYFETDPDEKNAAIDQDEKTMADAYATAPIGGLYDDYIAYLGSYAYLQNPTATQIAADREHIALTNQTGRSGGVNSIFAIWAGMLRGADHVDITITEDATGKVVFANTELNQHKSYNSGGSIRMSSIAVENEDGSNFSIADADLKNNTRYTVRLKAYTPYGDGGATTNLRNTFEFTFTTDFEAPAVTNCDFYTEYDNSLKKTRLYARISIYDNHYSQAAAVGVANDLKDPNSPHYDPESPYRYSLTTFDRYLSALYSDFNSTYTFTYELTDYLDDIRASHDGNSFFVQTIDYAMNSATYEIRIPDDITLIDGFLDTTGNPIDTLTLNPNEVYQIGMRVTPDTMWSDSVTLSSSDENVVGVVNGKLIARGSGDAVITARANSNPSIRAMLDIHVRSEGEAGYAQYTKPVVDSFRLTEYYIDKAYYFGASSLRDLGITDSTVKFVGSNYALSFFPSEQITLHYDIKAYFPHDVEVRFSSGNSAVATVDENGKITAVAEGNTSVSVVVFQDGKRTLYSNSVQITVKNPYTTSAYRLMSYMGLGGEVTVPDDLGITEIYMYAFSNYESVPKDLSAGDEISEEDPYYTKQVPIGENTITKIILPEGVETIDSYAFSKLTALEEVVLPSTLKKIQSYAFDGCTKLKKINLESVQFINQSAFRNCPLENVKLDSIVAIGNDAFRIERNVVNVDGAAVISAMTSLTLPVSAQSLGEGAFRNNAFTSITFNADSVKIGSYAFADCAQLTQVKVNAAVIPSYAFYGCKQLASVEIGKDVTLIGQYAFADTSVRSLAVDANNAVMRAAKDANNNDYITDKATGTQLILASFATEAFSSDVITTIGDGAFSGNIVLKSVYLPNATSMGNYAFAGCTQLNGSKVTFSSKCTKIGDYAFAGCSALNTLPNLNEIKTVGDYAFAGCTALTEVEIPQGMSVGEGAFTECVALQKVVIGNDVTLGAGAFMARINNVLSRAPLSDTTLYEVRYVTPTPVSALTSLTIGENVKIGDMAFCGNNKLTTVNLGAGAEIGAQAFYLCTELTTIDLSKAQSIGSAAFAGHRIVVYYYPLVEDRDVIPVRYNFIESKLRNVIIGAETIGEGAFAYNTNLTSITLENTVKTIGASAFIRCSALEDINLENVTFVGDMAFYDCEKLAVANLRRATYIGESAFEDNTALTSVTLDRSLSPVVTIGASAFKNATNLKTVFLGSVKEIGASAFENTSSLKSSIDLTSATTIGSFAFKNSGIIGVELGESLVNIGDNPFMNCAISSYTRGGRDTFELNNTVFVENGVLYTVTPNGGYELVSYPAAKQNPIYQVKDGTVRLAAGSFAGNAHLVSAELPYSLKSIGDKAFYQSTGLRLVVFKSVYAPILEEQYDRSYAVDENLPSESLGIIHYSSPFSTDPTLFYYGANFVNYVGKQTQPLIIVSPSNGEYYDAFVMSKYFTAYVAGSVAPLQTTLDAIAAIDALPDYITLSNKAQVEEARAAYDLVASREQQALVTNYNKLASAENTIRYLEENNDKPVTPGVEPTTDNGRGTVIALGVLVGVFGAVAIAVIVLWVLERLNIFVISFKKAKKFEVEEAKSTESAQDAEEKGEISEKEEEVLTNEADKDEVEKKEGNTDETSENNDED